MTTEAPGRRRKIGKWASVLAISATVLGGAGSAADGATNVADQAWAPQSPVTTFLAQPERLYVAVRLGQEEARTFIQLSPPASAAIAWGQTQLILAEDSADSLSVTPVRLAACVTHQSIRGSGELVGGGPQPDCRDQVVATRQQDGRWVVPLRTLAVSWGSAPDAGLVLLADTPGSTDTWRISFDASATTLVLPPTVPGPGSNAADGPAPVSRSGLTQSGSSPSTGPSPLPQPQSIQESAAPISPAPGFALPATSPASPAPTRAAGTSAPRPRRADSPSALAVFSLFGLVALVSVVGATAARGRITLDQRARGRVESHRLTEVLAVGALALPLGLGELNVYKVGLVLIVIVGALGLHLLVNWTGEVSLAHAGFVGVPAFAVMQLSAHQRISPIYLLPVAVVVGAAVGALVGLPALRARDLQVALVTLAAALAINSYFFSRPWLVGPAGGLVAVTPRLGPIAFRTSRSLYPILVIVTIIAVAALWLLQRSKMGRALLWVRANPDAAAAFGIPVAVYKLIAYALAGAFAGLAGGLSVAWVQRLTASAFPLSLSFIYLLVVIVAGRGLVGGVAVAAALFEGGQLFVHGAGALITYSGPIVLILVLTRYKAGLSGLGDTVMERLSGFVGRRGEGTSRSGPLRPLLLLGPLLIVAGFLAIALAWYHAGNTDQLWIQNQELVSGGVGGLALVVVGVGMLLVDRINQAAAALTIALERRADVAEPIASRNSISPTGTANGNDASSSTQSSSQPGRKARAEQVTFDG